MTVRAYVHRQWNGFGLNVTLVREYDDSSRREVLHLGEDGTPTYKVVESAAQEVRPTFSVTDEEAVALLAALHAQLQGVDNERMLRKDYNDERARVDKLSDALMVIAKQRTA